MRQFIDNELQSEHDNNSSFYHALSEPDVLAAIDIPAAFDFTNILFGADIDKPPIKLDLYLYRIAVAPHLDE
ncbi:hypothetical protein N0V82_004284 [Gnomoniopsis sp. IMI 355080]|nr:hypothetical protein N0V82_004284 [Gnomoniopsis sp. IMI 355080]